MATSTETWIEVLGEDVELPLNAFDVSHAEERWQFLWRLSEIGEEGLFIATSHVWSALAPPRAARCAWMAQQAGLDGRGRLALYGVLTRFIDVFNEETAPPPLPDPKQFASADAWHEAVSALFAAGDAAMSRVIDQWSAVLNGEAERGARGSSACGEVIAGPWKPLSSRTRRAQQLAAHRRGVPDIVSEADLLQAVAAALRSFQSSCDPLLKNSDESFTPGVWEETKAARQLAAFAHVTGLPSIYAPSRVPILEMLKDPEPQLSHCGPGDVCALLVLLVTGLSNGTAACTLARDAASGDLLRTAATRAEVLAEERKAAPLLLVGTDGGAIALITQLHHGERLFSVAADDRLFERSPRRRRWVPFETALRRLDDYSWPQLYPLAVDPVFAPTVTALLQNRLSADAEAWVNWNRYLKDPLCG